MRFELLIASEWERQGRANSRDLSQLRDEDVQNRKELGLKL